MHLNKLELRNYRNYAQETIAFDPGVNLIVGNNAQGKTNLLEAIAYLGSGKAFRTQRTADVSLLWLRSQRQCLYLCYGI